MSEINISRAKRVDNGNWIEGYYVQLVDSKENVSNRIYTGYSETDCGESFPDWHEIDPATLGACSALKDCNGEYIFFGDILRLTDETNGAEFTAVVAFGTQNGENSWGFQLAKLYGDDLNTGILCWVDMEDTGVYAEIIGNIYDNPELLKGDNQICDR